MPIVNLELNINDEIYRLTCPPHRTLLEVLREDFYLTGTKHGCELGECGACTVLIDGVPQLACLILPIEVVGKKITTIEGITEHVLFETFLEVGALQCGYCTPGMILTAKALLEQNPNPNEMAIKETISSVLCRCTGYYRIIEAIQAASERR